MPDEYAIPAAEHAAEIEIKKSRFIAIAKNAANRSEALAFLDEIKKRYPDARHHCWAYLLGAPGAPHSVAMSDDGEPSGTAGKPMLNVLQHKQVGDIMLVVVRYFGGIKLGAGGLLRAYSGAAQALMATLPTRTRLALSERKITCDFPNEQSVRHWLEKHEGQVLAVDYGERVTMSIAINKKHAADFDSFSTSLESTPIKRADKDNLP